MIITKNVCEDYKQAKEEAKERLKLVFEEFGALQEWEEIHFIQNKILKKYGIE